MLSFFSHFKKSKNVKPESQIVISSPLTLELSVSDVRNHFLQNPNDCKLSRKSRFGQTNSWIKAHDNSLYKLDVRLDRGSEGKIKKAFTEQGDQVAVKVIDLNKRYVNTSKEIEVLSKLGRLKNIVTRTINENTRRLYIFQEFIHARPMRQFLYSPFHPSTYEQKLIVAINYVKALLTLFEQYGIVHGDVKIDNAMVDKDLNVILVDFGFAQILPPGETMIEERVNPHTPGYAAPELLQHKHYSPASDIYALGVDFESDFNFPQEVVTSMKASLPQERPSHREILRRLKDKLALETNLSAKGREVIQEVNQILRTPAVATNYSMDPHPSTLTPWQPYTRKP